MTEKFHSYLLKGNENIYPQEDMYKKVHGHFIHISQKVGNGKTCGIFIQWNTSPLKKGMNYYIHNMDGSQRYYAK